MAPALAAVTLAAAALAAAAGLAGCTAGEGSAPAPEAAGAPAAPGAPPSPVGPADAARPAVPPAPAAPPGDPVKTTERREIAVLAGGCFWGMEEILRGIPGVVETEVGYCGGTLPGATYEDVKKGTTGHAESVKVVFDPDRISFEALLGWFFRMHDPTTLDRQGNDVGDSYRSAIFFSSEEQRATAERVKAAVDRSGKWKRPIVTRIEPMGIWSRAEEYHQDYLRKHPGGYTCHFLRD